MASKKKTIAVLIPHLNQYYQRDLWYAILKEADKLGYHALFFCGGVLKSPFRDERESNIIYNLCNLDQVDGILSVSGTLSNYAGMEVFEEFISRFNQKPIINISLELENSNCVTVDNYSSMKSLVTHVLSHHNYKKFAYITGPSTNTESFRRTRAFTDAMITHQISADNIRYYEGDFSIKSALKAVDYFLDEQNFIPDIIICANDEMAIGVHEALIARGIEMPDQIAFTGFDDIDNATTFMPAFTTIRQPIYEMGKASVQGLHQLITGQISSYNKSLAGTLVVRESCGCFNILDNRYLLNKDALIETKFQHLSLDTTTIYDILLTIANAHKGDYMKEIHELLITLVSELRSELPHGEFLKRLSKICYQAISSDISLFDGRWFIDWLRSSLMDYQALHMSNALTDILYESALIVSDNLIRTERRSNYDFLDLYYASSELILELTQVTDIEQLFQTVIPYLNTFSFDDFYVCLFDEPMYFEGNGSFVYPDEMTMQLRYTKNKVLPPCRFHTRLIIDPDLLSDNSKHQFTFYPLFFRKEHFGYIMCTVTIASRSIFRTIKEQITNTLERLRVNKQLADMAIKDIMTGLLNRRGIFEYLDLAMKEAQVTGKCIGVVYSDIDGLKSINDVYGHQSGDAAINAIGSVLFEVFSPYGEVARVGGDEFICILKKHEEDGYIESLFRQVIKSLQEYNSKNFEPFELSVSMGFAKWDPVGPLTINQVLNESDKALYRSKKKFRA